jgi:hypothetical protein
MTFGRKNGSVKAFNKALTAPLSATLPEIGALSKRAAEGANSRQKNACPGDSEFIAATLGRRLYLWRFDPPNRSRPIS